MSQNLVSNLTLRIEQEKKMMQEHQANIELFQQNTESLLNSSEQSLQSLEENAQLTTENAIKLLSEAKQSLVSVQTESKNLAKSLQQQTEETATLLSQQAQQLQSLKTQSAQLNSMSQEIAETAKIKKTLSTSNMVLASIALILLISSICLGYVSKANTTTSRIWNESDLSQAKRWEYEYSAVWRQENSKVMRTNRPRSPIVQQQFHDRAGDQLNELRSAVIEDHRRTTVAIEATTARTAESTGAYTSTVNDYRGVKELHANFKRETQRSSQDSAEISANNAKIIRTNYLSRFFTSHSRELENTVTDTVKRFSAELTDRESSQSHTSKQFAEVGTIRDRTTIEADDRSNNQENDFSRAISTKISGINPTGIFTALDQIDKRRELQRAQERKNDRGYDSPSPF
jgi:hypothetical protein